MADPALDLSRVRPAGELTHEYKTWQGTSWSNGWTPPEARAAIDEHDRGMFLRSDMIRVDAKKHPAVMGACRQRKAPSKGLSWRVEGATRAPGRYAVEDAATIWEQVRPLLGDILDNLSMMGFALLHHPWGLDARGLLMPRVSLWDAPAAGYYEEGPNSPAGYYAWTTEGLVPIEHGRGLWTVIGHGKRPHLDGAVRAVALEYVGGGLAWRDRLSRSAGAGRNVPIAELREGIAVNDEIGKSVQAMVASLGLPNRGGVVPSGTKITPLNLDASDAGYFSSLESDQLTRIALAILGQSGTLTKDGKVYTSPLFGDVAEYLVEDDVGAVEIGIRTGLFAPLVALDYPNVSPRDVPKLVGPLPDTGEAERIKLFGERLIAFHAAIEAEKQNGFIVDQERVNVLADRYGVPPPRLADEVLRGAEIYQYHIAQNVVARDEVRARLALPPLPNGAGSVDRLAEQLSAAPSTPAQVAPAADQ